MATFTRLIFFTGNNGPGKISGVPNPEPGVEQIIQILNASTHAAVPLSSSPGQTVGFYNGFMENGGPPATFGFWQWDTSDLSSTQFIAVMGNP